MVCKDCEKKLAAVIVPDKWKDGSKNAGEERKVNENKALGKRKMDVKNFNPYSRQCKICKSDCHQKGAYYCQSTSQLLLL